MICLLTHSPLSKLDRRGKGRMRKRDSWLTGEREGVGEEPYLTTARKLGPLLVIQKINTLSQCCGYGMFIPDPGSIELVYF